jgi:hypothetical protein
MTTDHPCGRGVCVGNSVPGMIGLSTGLPGKDL